MSRTARLFTALLAAAATTAALAPVAHATGRNDRTEVVNETALRRLVITLDPREADAQVIRLPVSHDMMVYRVRVEAVDGEGRRQGDLRETDIVRIQFGTARAASYVVLTSRAQDFTVPRPFGIPLTAADSLVLALAWTGGAMDGITLRVILDYDANATNRLSIAAVGARASEAPQDRTRVWEWQPSRDGRVVAMTGVPMAGVATMQLVDAETGAILWEDARSGHGLGGASSRAIVRMGASVRADHRYRLVLTYAADGGAPTASVAAVILPMT